MPILQPVAPYFKMKVLVACEFSGVVRREFQKLGHVAYSCDLLPALDGSTWHYRCDVRSILNNGWDLMIAHPPCTYLASAGLHWNKKVPGRNALTEKALWFVAELMASPIPFICIENPLGCISTKIKPFDQIVQPYEFGDDASKRTCLWLKKLPKLFTKHHERVAGRMVEYKGKQVERWSNQTDSGQNRLGPSEDRAKLRSITYPGIAKAMAEQWGCLNPNATYQLL